MAINKFCLLTLIVIIKLYLAATSKLNILNSAINSVK